MDYAAPVVLAPRLERAMPATDAPNVVARQLQFVCRWIIEVVSPLSEEQLRWQPGVTAPSIRFHLFHLARWADNLQSTVTEADGELWQRENVARRWGLDPDTLGIGESGATMDDEAAMRLALPDKDELVDYAMRAIMAADQALSQIDDAAFQRIVLAFGGRVLSIGEVITDQLEHMSRHLGMIEALRGVQSMNGTATI
jgi:hypothetical protein